jgi:MerR family mercuric resistance operon transcriptional regulator
MKGKLTIGELAKQAGVRDSAIRYYEKQGLLEPAGRTAGNYRYYRDGAVKRLRFIRSAQASGLSLDNILALLRFQDGKSKACAEVQEVIEGRLAEVNERMKQLRHVQRELKRYREACERTARGQECPVLEELGESGS